jgi:hypothetical protein
MKCVCAVALFLMCAAAGQADEPRPLTDGCHWTFPGLREDWAHRQCWCPDDYCRKSLPCVPANEKGCVDDYCRKSIPCVPANPKGCVDDFCRKTCPIFLGSLCEPWYRCGPDACPGGPVKP